MVTHTAVGRRCREDDPVRLSRGLYSSFIVRIWARNGALVHGHVTHIATRETLRFTDSRRLVAFILERLGGPRPRNPSWAPPPDDGADLGGERDP
jgi:hypothetical protein